MFLSKFASPVLNLPRIAKRLIVLAVDASLCVLTVWLAYYLRLDYWISLTNPDFGWNPMAAVGMSLLVAIPLFIVNGFYRAIFRYSGLSAIFTVTKVIAVYGVIYAAIFTAMGVSGVPRTVGIIQPILLMVFVGLTRLFARFWLGGLYRNQLQLANLPRVLIYGAGSTGRQLAGALANSHEMRVVGFIDDNKALHKQTINDLKIFNPKDLQGLVETLGVNTVLLAFSAASRKRRNEILDSISKSKVAVRTLPRVTEIATGKVSVSDLRELDIDDLLGRDPVSPDPELLSKNILGKVVLVTGSGGSIGSELCRQILNIGPTQLLLVEQSEFALYQIHQELEHKLLASNNSQIALVPFLASVRDEIRMDSILAKFKPQTIFHAAAYKHVPLVEHNLSEGIYNNVFGTFTTAKLALKHGAENFVLISTDKAVRPTNVMGATKRLAEMSLQALAETSSTTVFSMVRFGNVLGSSGSVVPLFRQQIRDGGPITLTHRDITRYFMTIPEAAQLVIQASALAEGGDVFLLDMGEPIKIYDLAVRMVELSGLSLKDESNPEGDIEIQITGLRPGEKLYEELLIGNEPHPTVHARIMRGSEGSLNIETLANNLEILKNLVAAQRFDLVQNFLVKNVIGYDPKKIVDWIFSSTN
ncbi:MULTISPECIES: nucleoside-diphosphate sugar epimerase/dehydratase [unclassified Limnobacter]|uniref:nucleoside-diphosphate sugar epimerase/dehydratase n=1 Tax=unclassified Limnobacter TaxID=2630203 RepID=UPI000C640284|nr:MULTISPECIES: nucleoside-diphosphate sugar epimerase/dehydratase [unclassified Limnobacter]MAG79447.1 polysaccharide biosynthesis protein [Sutterellaceae bacterium]|tara:strand:+ start:997 stop:2928 length:1932 start_codon:yes stop_codon:yes gene_type:complete